jgi:hypothetical protein
LGEKIAFAKTIRKALDTGSGCLSSSLNPDPHMGTYTLFFFFFCLFVADIFVSKKQETPPISAVMESDIALTLISYLNKTEQTADVQHQELVVQIRFLSPFELHTSHLSYHELTLVLFLSRVIERGIVGIGQSYKRDGWHLSRAC